MCCVDPFSKFTKVKLVNKTVTYYPETLYHTLIYNYLNIKKVITRVLSLIGFEKVRQERR